MALSGPDISRRRMLASVGAFLCLPRVAFPKDPGGKIALCIDESGTLGAEEPFVVGALFTANAEQHLEQFYLLRKETSYRLTLRYGSSDMHKVPYAQKLLDYFFAQNDLRFCALALPTARNVRVPSNPKIKEETYHDLYRKLLIQCAKRHENLSLHLKLRTTTGEDRFLHDYLRQKFNQIAELKIVRPYESDLIQFADLLTGCIAADKTHPDCQIKRSLVESLKKHLSVKSLWEPSLNQHSKFTVSLMEK
jgi:uncharacterized protein DUF3800